MTATVGSPIYLALLDSFRSPWAAPAPGSDTYEQLTEAWGHFADFQTPISLSALADAALDCLTASTFQSRDQLLEDARRLHLAKNAGYAGAGNPDPWANFRLSLAFNISPARGVYVRLSDKYMRITNLLRDPNNNQVGEAIEDTLRDLFAYALIAICLLEEEGIS